MTKKANHRYTYTTTNFLKHYVTIKRAEMTAEKGGYTVLIREIEADLAKYCKVSRDTISMIKRKANQPSLPLALKIAEYFNVHVEDIFKLVDEDRLAEQDDEVEVEVDQD